MSSRSFEQDLDKQLAKLGREKQPERDLWQGIDYALANEPNQHVETIRRPVLGNKLYLVAATVVMFAWMGWFSFNQQTEKLIGSELVAALSEQHEQQKNALLVSYEQQTALTENWQQQLEDLDQAADAVKAALKNEPNNIPLLKMLQNVHHQQISLIERVHAPKWSHI
ncbi:hypothetical protein L0668_06090 [Paraglaciecola aquimarina]|uniref:Anti-sigma factor n=1 Tax=Paraglaciecola algarum TaxID=3050085 RepID=A0ABS9D418_9ALTE|nr:hypothetical protein [Paraglaciecola sp. G1-23]MCF2947669.1 hypothetical protein [Paraglaciecola sp. G1-23]